MFSKKVHGGGQNIPQDNWSNMSPKIVFLLGNKKTGLLPMSFSGAKMWILGGEKPSYGCGETQFYNSEF